MDTARGSIARSSESTAGNGCFTMGIVVCEGCAFDQGLTMFEAADY